MIKKLLFITLVTLSINAHGAIDSNCLQILQDTPYFYRISHLLFPGADINTKDKEDRTTLHLAAKFNRTALVKQLIEMNASVNTKDLWGDTPLHDAASMNYKVIAEYLLAAGAHINAINHWGETPLHKAVKSSNINFAKFLINYGADITIKNDADKTPLEELNNKYMLILKEYYDSLLETKEPDIE